MTKFWPIRLLTASAALLFVASMALALIGCSGGYSFSEARFFCLSDAECPDDQVCGADRRCRESNVQVSNDDVYLPDYETFCSYWVSCSDYFSSEGTFEDVGECSTAVGIMSRNVILTDDADCEQYQNKIYDLASCMDSGDDCDSFLEQCLYPLNEMMVLGQSCDALAALLTDQQAEGGDPVSYYESDAPCSDEFRCLIACGDDVKCSQWCLAIAGGVCADCLGDLQACMDDNGCALNSDQSCPACFNEYETCFGVSPEDADPGNLPGSPPCAGYSLCFGRCGTIEDGHEAGQCVEDCKLAAGVSCSECVDAIIECQDKSACPDDETADQCDDVCQGLFFSCFGVFQDQPTGQ